MLSIELQSQFSKDEETEMNKSLLFYGRDFFFQ